MKITEPGEHWLPVVGYEGYEVSDHGRVRSLDRIIPYHKYDVLGPINRRHRGKVLSPGLMQSGHLLVVLGTGNCETVHRLVLMAFKGLPPDGCECCHGDGNPANNHIDNLRWDTRSANILDSVRHGTFFRGRRQPHAC